MTSQNSTIRTHIPFASPSFSSPVKNVIFPDSLTSSVRQKVNRRLLPPDDDDYEDFGALVSGNGRKRRPLAAIPPPMQMLAGDPNKAGLLRLGYHLQRLNNALDVTLTGSMAVFILLKTNRVRRSFYPQDLDVLVQRQVVPTMELEQLGFRNRNLEERNAVSQHGIKYDHPDGTSVDVILSKTVEQPGGTTQVVYKGSVYTVVTPKKLLQHYNNTSPKRNDINGILLMQKKDLLNELILKASGLLGYRK
jgi:hypothetical protein